MQTRFNLIAAAILAIAGLCSTISSHHITSVFFYVIGTILILMAFLSKDKKDDQINEIYTIVTALNEKGETDMDEKTIPPINANNSAVSFNQQGGITAHTVINKINPVTKVYGFSRGVTIYKPGAIESYSDENAVEFDSLSKFEKERKYPELIELCNKCIKEKPEWLTPYLFLGVAQANIGLKNDAINNLKHVVSEIENEPYYDDPNFQQAKTILHKLQTI